MTVLNVLVFMLCLTKTNYHLSFFHFSPSASNLFECKKGKLLTSFSMKIKIIQSSDFERTLQDGLGKLAHPQELFVLHHPVQHHFLFQLHQRPLELQNLQDFVNTLSLFLRLSGNGVKFIHYFLVVPFGQSVCLLRLVSGLFGEALDKLQNLQLFLSTKYFEWLSQLRFVLIVQSFLLGRFIHLLLFLVPLCFLVPLYFLVPIKRWSIALFYVFWLCLSLSLFLIKATRLDWLLHLGLLAIPISRALVVCLILITIKVRVIHRLLRFLVHVVTIHLARHKIVHLRVDLSIHLRSDWAVDLRVELWSIHLMVDWFLVHGIGLHHLHTSHIVRIGLRHVPMHV